jgi:hypothetical protein
MGRAVGAVKLKLSSIEFLERDVKLRMPFRFGVVTLTSRRRPCALPHPQPRTAAGAEARRKSCWRPSGSDKNPRSVERGQYEQLRASCAAARGVLAHGMATAWQHSTPKGWWRIRPALLDRPLTSGFVASRSGVFFKAITEKSVGAEGFEEWIGKPFSKLKPSNTSPPAIPSAGRSDHARTRGAW